MPRTPDVVVHTASSKSRPGLDHQVKINGRNGEIYCTCEGYMFDGSRPKRCAHIIEALEEGHVAAEIRRRPVLVQQDFKTPKPAATKNKLPDWVRKPKRKHRRQPRTQPLVPPVRPNEGKYGRSDPEPKKPYHQR